MNNLVITNNPIIKDGIKGKAEVDYRDASPAAILEAVAEKVAGGARLMGDPNRELKKYYLSVVMYTGTTEVSETSQNMIRNALVGIASAEVKKPALDGTAKKKDLQKVLQTLR